MFQEPSGLDCPPGKELALVHHAGPAWRSQPSHASVRRFGSADRHVTVRAGVALCWFHIVQQDPASEVSDLKQPVAGASVWDVGENATCIQADSVAAVHGKLVVQIV